MFLTSPNLSNTPHGFFTRKDGVSGGMYASLNCGWGTEDTLAHVMENRERAARDLGTNGTQLISLYQIHSNKVLTVDKPWKPEDRPQADAMVTVMPGIALGILTADCVPVLFADMTHGIIGAAHAGWKGALTGVLEQTVQAMLALGAQPASIAAAIGPSIRQASYEVSADYRDRFAERDATFIRYFIPSDRPAYFRFALNVFVRDILRGLAINTINTLENDTYIEEDDFFSFRRATHRGEPDYGRQISAIMLTS